MRLPLRRLVVAGWGVVVLSTFVGCAKSEAEPNPASAVVETPPIAVKTAPATAVKVPRVLTLSGSLTGAEQAQVAAGATGKILATYVERGSVVKKGAVLARLDVRILGAQSEEAEAQVETLKAQQSQARLDCDRTQHMFDKGAIAKADFDRAQTQCVTAKWSLAAAEARQTQVAESLRDAQIRAPFSGLVVERAVTSGEYVRPDSRVVTLVSVDALRVELTVPEADVAHIKPGMAVDFQTSGSDTRYLGHIKYIGPSVRQQSRDAIVEATVDNPTHELRPGMFVTARLALGEDAVPAVPKSAVKVDGAQRRVFVVVDGRIEERIVQAGEERSGSIPVFNGIKPGDRVVENLTADVRDGARVK
jgi:membrane fusion protein (multidrug efflux system)